MNTILFSHPACMDHDPGARHPENPERLKAIMAALEAEAFRTLGRREAPRASIEQIALVHDREHIAALEKIMPKEGKVAIDADTRISPGSWEAALRAAGAACAAVDAVYAGEARNAFCAVRPPGHHAEPAVAMGFCLFNNVAIAAAHARAAHGAKRVAVVDFDVHHGNGTQAAFWNDPDLFYASTHQSPLYPGTGAPEEHGVADNILNAVLRPMADSEAFRGQMREAILPAVRAFKPDLLLVSAGFDAHADDPLGQQNLTEADYVWATEELLALAEECCGGRLVSTLEGGYDLDALARSVSAHVETLMKHAPAT